MPSMTLLVDGTIPVAEDFNGNFRRLNQVVGVGTTIANYAPGDLSIATATDTLTRLPIGNPGDQLTVVSGLPAWSASASVSGTWQQRNLQGTLTASSLTVSADSVMLRNSALGVKVHEAVAGVTIDASATGLNGRDQTAAFTASQDLYAYWISNGVTVRGVWSHNAPPAGPDFSLPAFSGYTYWSLIAPARWSALSTFTPARVRGSRVFYEGLQSVLTDGQATAETAVSVSAFVPAAALDYTLNLQHVFGPSPWVFRLRVLSGVDLYAPPWPGTPHVATLSLLLPNVAQQFFYQWAGTPGAVQGFYASVTGYRVGNGGD